MDNYEKLEEELKETKAYARRVIDLWVDSRKWAALAKMANTDEEYSKYMNIANTLKEMFNNEIQNMKI